MHNLIYTDDNTPIWMYFARYTPLDNPGYESPNPYIQSKGEDVLDCTSRAIDDMLQNPAMKARLIAAQCPLTVYDILHSELSQRQRAGFLEALQMLWMRGTHLENNKVIETTIATSKSVGVQFGRRE